MILASVSLSRGQAVEQIVILFGAKTRGDAVNTVLDGGPHPHNEGRCSMQHYFGYLLFIIVSII